MGKDTESGDGPGQSSGRRLFDIRAKPFVVKAIFFAFLAVIAAMLGMAAMFAWTGALDTTTAAFIVIFVILYIAGALLILKERLYSYVVSLIFALILLLLFGPVIADSIAVPTGPFPALMEILFGLSFIVLMSLLGILGFKRGVENRRHLASADSKGGILAGVFIGIVIGAIIVGMASGVTIERVIKTGRCVPSSETVCIEYGSGSMSNPVFYTPRSLTATVANGTITWMNSDTMTHTVTADDGSFDSGNIAPGASWSYKFGKAGTYKYHCAPHPWMTATVVVA